MKNICYKNCGENKLLKDSKTSLNYNKLKPSAFSLIELSIVLIIIGLLVAGVTGGGSLIKSAKIRSAIGELRNYNVVFNTFKTANDRLPGDINNDGLIGWIPNSNGNANTSEANYSGFGGDYSGISVGYRAGPWVELYLEGITDFKPFTGTGNVLSSNNTGVGYREKNYPAFKSIPGTYINKTETFLNYVDVDEHCLGNNLINGLYLYIDYEGNTKNNGIDTKFLENVDRKIDDGIYNSGTLRSHCYGSETTGKNSYQNAIDNKKPCTYFYYRISEL